VPTLSATDTVQEANLRVILLRSLVWPIQHFNVKQTREALLRLNGLTFSTSASISGRSVTMCSCAHSDGIGRHGLTWSRTFDPPIYPQLQDINLVQANILRTQKAARLLSDADFSGWPSFSSITNSMCSSQAQPFLAWLTGNASRSGMFRRLHSPSTAEARYRSAAQATLGITMVTARLLCFSLGAVLASCHVSAPRHIFKARRLLSHIHLEHCTRKQTTFCTHSRCR
jgi:hypothetical protein